MGAVILARRAATWAGSASPRPSRFTNLAAACPARGPHTCVMVRAFPATRLPPGTPPGPLPGRGGPGYFGLAVLVPGGPAVPEVAGGGALDGVLGQVGEEL